MNPARAIRVEFQKPWTVPGARGLLTPDPRIRTLCRVLVSYPEVRHIVPDRVTLDPGADERTLDTVARFLQRQQWLVKAVSLE